MQPSVLIRKFRARGRKVTPQRLALFQALQGNTSHPTAEDLYRTLRRRHPTITLATVYQTLKLLRDDGEIRELTIERGGRHYDPDTRPHHHAVCTRCGSVRDMEGHPTLEIPLPPADTGDFAFAEYQIAFYGTCRRCRDQEIEEHQGIPEKINTTRRRRK